MNMLEYRLELIIDRGNLQMAKAKTTKSTSGSSNHHDMSYYLNIFMDKLEAFEVDTKKKFSAFMDELQVMQTGVAKKGTKKPKVAVKAKPRTEAAAKTTKKVATNLKAKAKAAPKKLVEKATQVKSAVKKKPVTKKKNTLKA